MLDVSIQVDPASISEFHRAIDRLQLETSRGMEQSLIYGALKVAQSGRAAAKRGKKNRDVIANPEWRQARSSFAWARRQRAQGKAIPAEAEAALQQLNAITPLFILFRRQSGKPVEVGAYERKDPRREIKLVEQGGRRGLAKKTWGVMVGKLGAMRPETTGGSTGQFHRISRYRDRHGNTAGQSVVRLINKLNYLETAFPGITRAAMRKGTAAINGMLDRKMKRAAERANR